MTCGKYWPSFNEKTEKTKKQIEEEKGLQTSSDGFSSNKFNKLWGEDNNIFSCFVVVVVVVVLFILILLLLCLLWPIGA